MNGPLSGADTPDYSRWFVCSTVDHALFPAKSQGKSTADNMKLKPNVVFCPPATERPAYVTLGQEALRLLAKTCEALRQVQQKRRYSLSNHPMRSKKRCKQVHKRACALMQTADRITEVS